MSTKNQILTPSMLLLDKNDRVISAHLCPKHAERLSCPQVGDDFASLFGVERNDLSLLHRCRRFSGSTTVLLYAKRPILVIAPGFATLGLTLIVLPDVKRNASLCAPAEYCGAFADVMFAPSAMSRTQPITEEGFAQFMAHMQAYHGPFALKPETTHIPTHLLRLRSSILALTPLFDCTADFNWKEISAGFVDTFNPDLALGAVSAILMLARRKTGGCLLSFSGEWSELGDPLLRVTLPFVCANEPELTAPRSAAFELGLTFDVSVADGETQILFSCCTCQLSVQGVKRFDSPAPGRKEYAIPKIMDFPKPERKLPPGAIPLFHNGEWAPGGVPPKKKK